jgi:hypothetical protein
MTLAMEPAKPRIRVKAGSRPSKGHAFHSATRTGANTENDDVDGSAERAVPETATLPGEVESRFRYEVVDGNASLAAREGEKPLHPNSKFGPDAGAATHEAPGANAQGGIPVGANASHSGVTGGESAATDFSSPGSDADAHAAHRNPEQAVRSDSRSCPEGSSVNGRERPMPELPERGGSPHRPAVDVTAGETAPNSNSSATSSRQTDKAGTEVPPVPATTPPRKPLRPHCLNPQLCAGSGSNHCHACKKALAERADGGANIVMKHLNIAGAA